jgi:hypothetical protein
MKYGLGDSCGLLRHEFLSQVIIHILQRVKGEGGCERGRNIDPKEKSNVKSSPYSEG